VKIVHWRSSYPACRESNDSQAPARTGPDRDFRQAATARKGVEKPACPTTPALPFPVRSEGDADPGRPELAACLDYLRPGDTLVVPSLDRLSRSLQDLFTIVAGLRRRGVGFRSLHEALDITTPGGRLVLHVFAALAEFSANSSSRAPARAWTPPAPAASASAGPRR